jgi:hypothetical protein
MTRWTDAVLDSRVAANVVSRIQQRVRERERLLLGGATRAWASWAARVRSLALRLSAFHARRDSRVALDALLQWRHVLVDTMRRRDLVMAVRRLRASRMALNALLAWHGVTVRALRTCDLVSESPCLADNPLRTSESFVHQVISFSNTSGFHEVGHFL